MQSVVVALDQRHVKPRDTRVGADPRHQKSNTLGERAFTLPPGVD